MKVNLQNITPGEILLEDYLIPLGLSQNAAARLLNIPPRRLNEIVLGKRAITLDTSMRIGRLFGQNPRFWLDIQIDCDLRAAEPRLLEIKRTIRPMAMA
jgi:antitoxin HigA-1